MTLNGVMAVILRYSSGFGSLRKSSRSLSHLLMSSCKLTADQYRDEFRTAIKRPEEAYTLFSSRVKSLLYYLDTRKVTTKDQVSDILVSDRIKETLGPACPYYVLRKRFRQSINNHTASLEITVNVHESVLSRKLVFSTSN